MISIHQSQFLSWLPFFYKLLHSDTFVVLDDVQFQKNGVQNRNMIKTPTGPQWITVPVNVSLGDSINTVTVADLTIYPKILKTIEINYKKSPYFSEIYGLIERTFRQQISSLHTLNDHLFKEIITAMPTIPLIEYSSQLGTTQKNEGLVLEIIEHYGAKKYLSGPGALGYMNLEQFKKRGIEVYVARFEYQEYSQLWNKQRGFAKDLSIIDLLFNQAPTAYEYIKSCGSIERVI